MVLCAFTTGTTSIISTFCNFHAWDVRLREECYNGLFLRFRMYGLFQTTFYFGYMALFSLTLGVMCGKYHFTATLLHVHIYMHVHVNTSIRARV